MSKRFLLIMAALVAVFVGAIIISKNQDSANAPSNGSDAGQTNHVQGAGNKNVTLVEFADFQCPACASYFPLLKQVKEKYGDDITFQFRHFPLVQIHPNAMVAHRAAEAAAKQDKFWQMHDILYERQNSWKDSSNMTLIVEDYASELALNIDQFKADFSSSEVNDLIQADIKAGQQAGVNSTPTFVLNGAKIEDMPDDLAGFSKLIDDAIAQQNQ